MTVLATLPDWSGWTSTRLDWLFDKVKEVNHPNATPLSVFLGLIFPHRTARQLCVEAREMAGSGGFLWV